MHFGKTYFPENLAAVYKKSKRTSSKTQMSCFQFSLDIFISKVKILNTSLIGSDVFVKIFDSEPVKIGDISPRARGRTTIDFNAGLHLCLKMTRSSLPSKLPIVLITESDTMQFAGGVNALDLLQESIMSKQQSCIAREHVKVISTASKEGAIFTFRLRITSEKTPIAKRDESKPIINSRACDILKTNEHYRQICKRLNEQVLALEAKVDRISNRTRIPGDAIRTRTTTGTTTTRRTTATGSPRTHNVSFATQATQGTRTRPPLDFVFDDHPSGKRGKKSKRRNSDDFDSDNISIGSSSTAGGYSESGLTISEQSSSIVDSDTPKKGRRNRKVSDYDVISDVSYSSRKGRKGKKSASERYSSSISSVGSVSTGSSSSSHSSSSKSDEDLYESILDVSSEYYSQSKKRRKPSPPKKKSKSSYSSSSRSSTSTISSVASKKSGKKSSPVLSESFSDESSSTPPKKPAPPPRKPSSGKQSLLSSESESFPELDDTKDKKKDDSLSLSESFSSSSPDSDADKPNLGTDFIDEPPKADPSDSDPFADSDGTF